MEQPSLIRSPSPPPVGSSSPASSNSGRQQETIKMTAAKNRRRMSLPNAQELVSHYESQGLDHKQASLKVIDDLQKALFRLVTADKSGSASASRKQPQQQLELINGRLVQIDMKLDSKPGYPHMVGIGVVSAAAFRGFETLLLPQVAGAFASIWNAVVRSTTNPNDNI